MSHIVLLGDSIFDNAAYVGDGPDVIQQLRALLPADWRASLLAVDGSITSSVRRQLNRLPTDVTHLILSVGGNDALRNADVLHRRANSTAEALNQLAKVADQFEQDYNEMLREVLAQKLPTAICTVYYPCYPDADMQRLSVTALTLFNDCIIRAAFLHGLPLLDLRFICNEAGDYANPIEPSVQGGEKISRVIKSVVTSHDFSQKHTVVFV